MRRARVKESKKKHRLSLFDLFHRKNEIGGHKQRLFSFEFHSIHIDSQFVSALMNVLSRVLVGGSIEELFRLQCGVFVLVIVDPFRFENRE